MSDKVGIENHIEFSLVCSSAFRYAHGRKTYIVDSVISFLTDAWPHIDQNIRTLILDEIYKETHNRYATFIDGKLSNVYKDLEDKWLDFANKQALISASKNGENSP